MIPVPTYEGKDIGDEGRVIAGWAWNPACPHDLIDEEKFSGSVQAGHGKAKKFELELAKAEPGNSMHRFKAQRGRLLKRGPGVQVLN